MKVGLAARLRRCYIAFFAISFTRTKTVLSACVAATTAIFGATAEPSSTRPTHNFASLLNDGKPGVQYLWVQENEASSSERGLHGL